MRSGPTTTPPRWARQPRSPPPEANVYDGSNEGVIVFGQNGDLDAITAIKEHRLTGTLDPDPVATGWALIKALSGFVGKDKVANPPKRLVVKSARWTLENIDDYRPPRERHYTLDTVPLIDAGTR